MSSSAAEQMPHSVSVHVMPSRIMTTAQTPSRKKGINYRAV